MPHRRVITDVRLCLSISEEHHTRLEPMSGTQLPICSGRYHALARPLTLSLSRPISLLPSFGQRALIEKSEFVERLVRLFKKALADW